MITDAYNSTSMAILIDSMSPQEEPCLPASGLRDQENTSELSLMASLNERR